MMTKIEKGRLTKNFTANREEKEERRQRRYELPGIFKY